MLLPTRQVPPIKINQTGCGMIPSMSTKSNKSWKDHLLSSGVPLEYSVRRIFEELGIHNPSEYRYVRKTAEGVSQIFSVDVHSKKIDVHRDLRVEHS